MSPPEENASRLELYKLLVEMADRVSQRRQSANSFYLSINTALTGATAYMVTLGPRTSGTIVLGVAGVAISVLWFRNILSYKTLNAAKFAVITEIEKSLPLQPFTDEWGALDPDGDGKRHVPFHKVEVVVPWVFAAAHGAQIALAIPWRRAIDLACRSLA